MATKRIKDLPNTDALTAGDRLPIDGDSARSISFENFFGTSLLSLRGLSTAANKIPYFSAPGTGALADFTSFGRTLVASVSSADARMNLDLGDVQFNPNTASFNTYAEAVESSPNSGILSIRLLGYSAPGRDGSLWTYTATAPAHGVYFTAANGRKYELAENSPTPEMLGAVGDYDVASGLGTNDTAALKKWAAYPAPHKRLLAKAYLTHETLTCAVDCVYEGVPGKSMIVGKPVAGGGAYTVAVATFSGASDPVRLPDLRTNAVRSNTRIDCNASVSGYGVDNGDVLIIYDKTNGSWCGFRTYYRAGEMLDVTRISSSVGTNDRINFASRLLYDYTVANVELYFFKKKALTISGIEFRAPGDGGIEAVRLRLLKDVTLNRVLATNADVQGGHIDRCFNVNGLLGGWCRAAESGNQYAWVFSNTSHLVVEAIGDSTRHPFAIGGNDGSVVGYKGAVVNRNIVIRNSQIYSGGSSGMGSDVHGNVDDCLFDKCIIQNGASFGGKDITYRDCLIQGGDFINGCCVYAGEMRGGKFVLDGCVLETTGNPSAAGVNRGVIDFGGNSTAFSDDSRQPAKLIIRDCVVRIDSLAADVIRVSSASTLYSLDIDIDGLTIEGGASVSALVRYGVSSGAAKAKYISIQRIQGLKAGAALAATSGATSPWNASTRMRMPTFSGSASLAAANGVGFAVEGGPQAFPWIYPAAPHNTFAMTSPGGSPIQNNKGILPFVYSKDEAGIRHAITSHDGFNWNGALSVKINWQVGPSVEGFA